MTPSEDLREVCRSRGILRLIRVDRLSGLLRWLVKPLADCDLVAEVAAECAIRAWLARRDDPWNGVKIPAEFLPLEMDQQLRNWLHRNQDKRLMEYDDDLPHPDERGFTFMTHFVQSLAMWRQANGFVPLVIRNDGQDAPEAIALPFVIQRRGHRADPFVATADGLQAEVTGLRSAWDRAWRAAVQYGWVTEGDLFQARMIGLTPAMAGIPRGESATLPFLVAIFHRALRLKVPSLDWAASGEFDVVSGNASDLGYLSEEWKAKEQLIESIGIAEKRQLLTGFKHSQKECAGENFSHLFKSIFSDYEIHPNLDETNRELQQIDDLMSNGRPDLQVLASQLDGIRASIAGLPGLRWEVCRSYAIKVRADLYCHQGLPDRCIELLPDLAESSSKQGCEALIRIAVASTDLCRHDDCERMCSSALDAAAILTDLDRRLVNLSAYGSRGQGRMYKALEVSDQEWAESGRKDLEEAFRLARELDEGMSREKYAQARNLTYLLLWHSLHDPGQVGDLYAEALKLSRDVRHGDGYVQRAAHLARYRMLLSGSYSQLSWWPTLDPPIPDPASGDGYPAATALKYRGTYRAKLGDFEGAKHDFDLGSAILKSTGGWLLTFIRGTILLQAGESLISWDPDMSTGYLRESAALFEAAHGFGLIKHESAVAPDKWLLRAKHLLDHRSPPLINPQFLYQY